MNLDFERKKGRSGRGCRSPGRRRSARIRKKYQTVWEATEYQQVYSGMQFGSGGVCDQLGELFQRTECLGAC